MSKGSGTVHGVVIIDKPKGMTSFDVVAEARRKMGTARVGHTGTLDPMATGVLPLCFGEATKLVPFLTECDKSYEADVLFGVGTTTGDAEGEVTATADASGLTIDALRAAATRLTGPIEQRPPMHSAIKVNGQRLYELARLGQEVERAARPIVVQALALEPKSGATYSLRITCSKGTYVRVIAEDLGMLVGVPAHLTALRRTAVGVFELARAVPLEQLRASTPLIELADAIAHLPKRELDEQGTERIRSGQERWLFGLADPPPEGRCRLLDAAGRLVAVISRANDTIAFERVFAEPVSQAPSGGG